jgi:N utilization substance protein B
LGKRRKTREYALQVLYQWEMTGQDVERGLALLREHLLSAGGEDSFLDRLVRGVSTHREEIDRLIEGHSEHWRLERMPPVDRNILRIAAFELLYCEEVPPRVSVNEAVELAKRFGSEDSPAFVNGILDRIMTEIRKTQALGGK